MQRSCCLYESLQASQAKSWTINYEQGRYCVNRKELLLFAGILIKYECKLIKKLNSFSRCNLLGVRSSYLSLRHKCANSHIEQILKL